MDELMLMEYLKNRGMDEQDFMDKFKDFMVKHNRGSYNRGFSGSYNRSSYNKGFEDSGFGWEYDMDDSMSSFKRGRNTMKRDRGMSNEYSKDHFIPAEAQYIVSEMYHTENGRKYTGEKYDIDKAREVCERYRGFIPSTVNPVDIYVAINAQYHDYANLFKSWFGEKIDHKVIESAIVFWFKDEDNLGTAKLVSYFREK